MDECVCAHCCVCSAFYPFKEVQGSEVPHDMLQAKFAFAKPVWSKVSANCKNFISRLLQKDAKDRLTSEEALRHVWFTPIHSRGEAAAQVAVTIPILPKAPPTSPIPIPGAVPPRAPAPAPAGLSISHSFLTHMEEGMQLGAGAGMTDRELMPPPSVNTKKRKGVEVAGDATKVPGDAEVAIVPVRVTRAKSKK